MTREKPGIWVNAASVPNAFVATLSAHGIGNVQNWVERGVAGKHIGAAADQVGKRYRRTVRDEQHLGRLADFQVGTELLD